MAPGATSESQRGWVTHASTSIGPEDFPRGVREPPPIMLAHIGIKVWGTFGDQSESGINCLQRRACFPLTVAMISLLRWQGRYNTADWVRKNYGDGEWPEDLAKKLDRANVRYAYVINGDVKFLGYLRIEGPSL